jgi:3-dehydro-L-gulonate 2-dehydrogenase
LLLDILAAVLSGGFSTHQVATCTTETNVSQVFIAMQLRNLHNFSSIEKSIDLIIEDLKKSVPEKEGATVRYPGENIKAIRLDNQENGVPVRKEIWDRIKALC